MNGTNTENIYSFIKSKNDKLLQQFGNKEYFT